MYDELSIYAHKLREKAEKLKKTEDEPYDTGFIDGLEKVLLDIDKMLVDYVKDEGEELYDWDIDRYSCGCCTCCGCICD